MIAARPVRTVVAAFTRTRFFRRFGPRIMPPVEHLVARLTGGRAGPISGVIVPSLVLHTIGARSGQPRTTALMCCPVADGTILVTGSNFAADSHPAWSYNLLAHPDAEIDYDGSHTAVHAELIPDSERDAVWRLLDEQWPGYRGYERASGRILRIFRLAPR